MFRWMTASGLRCATASGRFGLACLVGAPLLLAQVAPPPPPPPGASPGTVTKDVLIERVGSGFQFFAAEPALLGAPVKGAPYSAETVNETTRVLADGTRIEHRTTTRVARDSEGRTRVEQSIPLGPDKSRTQITISDPVNRKTVILDPEAQTARVVGIPPLPPMPPMPPGADGAEPKVMTWVHSGEAGSGSTNQQNIVIHRRVQGVAGPGVPAPPMPPMPPEGPAPHIQMLPMGAPGGVANIQIQRITTPDNLKVEDLGDQQVQGVPAKGTRRTLTIPTGAIGNDRPIISVTEEWTSPDLKVVLLRTTRDPQIGEITYKLTNLNRSEPLKELFEIPAGYKELARPTAQTFEFHTNP